MVKISVQPYLLALLAPGLLIAGVSISGPVAGYVAEIPGPGIRAITGVPGAFAYSDPLALPEGIIRVRLAPGRDFALVERAEASLGILHLNAGAADRVDSIGSAMAAADWVVFGPSGQSAMLFSASANRLQVLSGLPDAPRITLDLDGATLPERPHTGTVSDDGRLVLIASFHAVYRLGEENGAQLLLSGARISSVAVFHNGRDAAVSDHGTGTVYLLPNAAAAAGPRVLASGLDGAGKIWPSWDGTMVFVARASALTMSSVVVASGEVRSFASYAAPVTLQPLRNRDTFLISASQGEPGWIFYRDGHDARVAFVPAVADTPEIEE